MSQFPRNQRYNNYRQNQNSQRLNRGINTNNLSYLDTISAPRPNRGIDISDFPVENRPNRFKNNHKYQKSPSYEEDNYNNNRFKNRHKPLSHHISDYYHNKGAVSIGCNLLLITLQIHYIQF